MKETPDMKKMLDLIVKVTTRFMSIAGEEMGYWIEMALQDLGKFYQVDRCGVFLFSPDGKQMSNTHEWCGKGVEPQINRLKNIPLKNFPWLKAQLRRKTPVVINNLERLPAEAKNEKQEFQSREIKSLLIAPMIYNKTRIGLLELDVVKAPRRWQSQEVVLLKMIADIFTSALERKKTEKNLTDTESLYQVFMNTINEGIAVHQNDRFIFINNNLAEMLGFKVDELIGKDYREIYTRRGLDLLEERRRLRQLGKNPPQRFETTFKCKDGHTIDVEISSVVTDYRGALATFSVINDITEYKRLNLAQQTMEVKLLKQQRLMALTLMISGIIHNIKNTLTVVMGRAQLLKTRLPELKEPDIIVNNVKKIESLLTSFVEKIALERENKKIPINLSDLLKNELLFLETESFFKTQIVKELYLQRDLPSIVGYYSDFSQGLMNIIHCCVESTRDIPEKKLTIETGTAPDAIYVEIITTGEPIISGNIEEFFTPGYFRPSQGVDESTDQVALTKFNLYNAYMLLNGYGAKFSAVNNPEGGTTFRILFPVEQDR